MTKSDRFASGIFAAAIFAVGGYIGIVAHPIYILVFAVPAWSIGMKAARGY